MENDALTFWVAYFIGADEKYHYLGSDGKIRLFKTEAELNTFLDDNITKSERAMIYTTSITGLFAVPEPEQENIIMPISTLAPMTMPMPTAMELLNNYKRRNSK